MNGQIEVTWRALRNIVHSITVHGQVSDEYIHFAFMYTNVHILHVIPIKHLLNQGGEPTTPHKLKTGNNLQHQTYVFYKKQLHTETQRH